MEWSHFLHSSTDIYFFTRQQQKSLSRQKINWVNLIDVYKFTLYLYVTLQCSFNELVKLQIVYKTVLNIMYKYERKIVNKFSSYFKLVIFILIVPNKCKKNNISTIIKTLNYNSIFTQHGEQNYKVALLRYKIGYFFFHRS